MAVINKIMDQKPEYDFETERAFIGSIIKQPSMGSWHEDLTAEHFFFDKWRYAFEKIKDLISSGQPVSSSIFLGDPEWPDLYMESGAAADESPYGQTDRYSNWLIQMYLTRKAKGVALTALKDLSNGSSGDQVLTRVKEEIEGIESPSSASGPVEIQRSVASAVDQILNWGKSKILLGLPDLDRAIGGKLPRGSVVIGAARSGVGKSQFLVDLVCRKLREQFETKEFRPIAVFTLEMTHEQFTMRVINNFVRADCANVDFEDERNMDLLSAVFDVANTLAQDEINLLIYDNPALTIEDIDAETERLQKAHGDLAMIGIDYFQLVTSERNVGSRLNEMNHVSRMHKVIAARADFLLSLAQVSRDIDKRDDKRPTVADIVGTSSMENDSDLILGLYRESRYTDDHDGRDITEIICLKYRHGMGDWRVKVLGRWEYSRIEQLELERTDLEY